MLKTFLVYDSATQILSEFSSYFYNSERECRQKVWRQICFRYFQANVIYIVSKSAYFNVKTRQLNEKQLS
jgi:hypothetical protein